MSFYLIRLFPSYHALACFSINAFPILNNHPHLNCVFVPTEKRHEFILIDSFSIVFVLPPHFPQTTQKNGDPLPRQSDLDREHYHPPTWIFPFLFFLSPFVPVPRSCTPPGGPLSEIAHLTQGHVKQALSDYFSPPLIKTFPDPLLLVRPRPECPQPPTEQRHSDLFHLSVCTSRKPTVRSRIWGKAIGPVVSLKVYHSYGLPPSRCPPSPPVFSPPPLFPNC